MNILAFDCSTETLHLGLSAGARRHTASVAAGAATSALLLPQVASATAALGLSLGDIDLIAFGQGPGAFTGVRAACAAAQGLGYGLGRPVLALPTLEVVARAALSNCAVDARWLWVAMDARMGEVYAQCYEINSNQLSTDAGNVVVSPNEFLTLSAVQRSNTACWLAGNAARVHGALATLPRWLDAQPTPDALLDTAASRVHLAAPSAQAAPLYVRDRVALTTAERAQGAVL
jgi:tRNA threonylcarbamoyladenosine biosynthesis protein TsaB